MKLLQIVICVLSMLVASGLWANGEAVAALHSFKEAMREQMVARLKTISKGSRIEAQTPSGPVVGIYGGYDKFDESIWITKKGHFFGEKIDIDEIRAIRPIDLQGKV